MNNIWHTSIFIPDPFKAHPIIVIYEAGDEIEQMMSNEYRTRVGDRYVNRWCYANDLLNCEKALGIAVDALKEMERWLGVIRGSMVSHLNNKNNTLLEHYDTDPTVQNIDKAKKILKNQLNEITALEQKD